MNITGRATEDGYEIKLTHAARGPVLVAVDKSMLQKPWTPQQMLDGLVLELNRAVGEMTRDGRIALGRKRRKVKP